MPTELSPATTSAPAGQIGELPQKNGMVRAHASGVPLAPPTALLDRLDALDEEARDAVAGHLPVRLHVAAKRQQRCKARKQSSTVISHQPSTVFWA